MPFTTTEEKALLGAAFGGTTYTPPTDYYVGLIIAATWAASTAYTAGQYVVPTTFSSITGPVGKVFKCTTAGTSGSSAPTWPTTAGGTVTDGTVVWTEVSALFAAGTFTGAEPSTSGTGYARVHVANTTTNFPTPTGGDPATTANSPAIVFPSTTASWGQIVGVVFYDASSGGTARSWSPLSGAPSGAATAVGQTPQIAASQLTLAFT
jgi:hypothetical protein